MWLTKDHLRDSSSWTSPPLVLLRDIHSKFLTQYESKEVCTPSQSQVNTGTGGGPSSQSQVNIGTGPRPSSQDGVSQIQEPVPLSLPQLNRLVETSFVWDENSDPTRRDEQLNLRSQQGIVATVEDSVLRTEMAGLESLEEDDPKNILFYNPMGCLGQIRSHRRDESWCPDPSDLREATRGLWLQEISNRLLRVK